MNYKVLVSSGCSFTQVPNKFVNWPKYLTDNLNLKPVYLGSGATGNGFISKKLIFNITELLKEYNPEDILVGIMWSGPDRNEFYHSKDFPHTPIWGDDRYKNPQKIVTNNWYIVNANWEDESSKLWYKHFHDDIGGVISTLEHMLRVQWFLKLNKIDYFMTTYAPHTLPKEFLDHDEIKHLFDLLDLNNFLPISNALDWMFYKSGKWHENEEDGHPPSEANLAFVNEIIMPHLKLMGYID